MYTSHVSFKLTLIKQRRILTHSIHTAAMIIQYTQAENNGKKTYSTIPIFSTE